MTKSDFKLLSTAKDLTDELANSSFSGEEWVAIDAERASGFKYRQRAYLLQLGFENGDTWLVDPLMFDSEAGRVALDNLRSTMPKSWILHSATQDFPCLFDLDLRPNKVFDTELAAKLLGLPRVGLASLLSEFLDISLAKEHSASDWSIRPLPESMLEYAAADVHHLHALMTVLESQLEESSRTIWASEEFAHLITFTPKPTDESKWKKLSGLQKIKDPRILRMAKALWVAREEFAREIDMSPGRVLPDRSILAAAVAQPTSKSKLAAVAEFKGRFSRSKLDLWWGALETSETIQLETQIRDSDFIPHHRTWERKHPEAHERYLRVRPRIAEVAESLKIAPEVLVTPEAIRAICFAPPSDPSGLLDTLERYRVRPWQRSLAYEAIESEIFPTS